MVLRRQNSVIKKGVNLHSEESADDGVMELDESKIKSHTTYGKLGNLLDGEN